MDLEHNSNKGVKEHDRGGACAAARGELFVPDGYSDEGRERRPWLIVRCGFQLALSLITFPMGSYAGFPHPGSL